MLNIEISKELKCQIESNQNQLKTAIRNHQVLISKYKNASGVNTGLEISIEEAQQQIIIVGLEQKLLVERLRKEYRLFQRTLKTTAIRNGIEERRFNLSNAINRARKQNIITRTTSIQSNSPSEESEHVSSPPTPEPPIPTPLNPQDLPQTEFLTYFGLATHDVFKEMQNKRAERKRRSTANPQFLYTRGWDISKRKRNMYLASTISPPNTRQAMRNKTHVPSPVKASRPSSPIENKKLIIPNIPSGLTIEKITAARTSADNKLCIECRLPGNLSICEICTNGFHVSCHSGLLAQPPKHCPKCQKEVNSANPAASAYVSDVTEKLKKSSDLLEKNKELTAELTQLQDKHSQLTITLKTQQSETEELTDSKMKETEIS